MLLRTLYVLKSRKTFRFFYFHYFFYIFYPIFTIITSPIQRIELRKKTHIKENKKQFGQFASVFFSFLLAVFITFFFTSLSVFSRQNAYILKYLYTCECVQLTLNISFALNLLSFYFSLSYSVLICLRASLLYMNFI